MRGTADMLSIFFFKNLDYGYMVVITLKIYQYMLIKCAIFCAYIRLLFHEATKD